LGDFIEGEPTAIDFDRVNATSFRAAVTFWQIARKYRNVAIGHNA